MHIHVRLVDCCSQVQTRFNGGAQRKDEEDFDPEAEERRRKRRANRKKNWDLGPSEAAAAVSTVDMLCEWVLHMYYILPMFNFRRVFQSVHIKSAQRCFASEMMIRVHTPARWQRAMHSTCARATVQNAVGRVCVCVCVRELSGICELRSPYIYHVDAATTSRVNCRSQRFCVY